MVRLGIIGAALLVLALAACGDDGGGSEGAAPQESEGVRVVTSLEVLADLARNVAGERGEVDALLPAGADPHTFELSPSRAADIARADIVFINGLDLEQGIEDVIDNSAEGAVIALAEEMPLLDGNPHVWLDVRHAALYVERIRDELSAVDSEGAAAYEANASAYLERLGDLDRELEEAVQAIPAENRKLVTFHDAFSYLAARYGLEVVGVVVASPGQEPSAQAVADLVRTLRGQDVPAVFKEPQFNAEVLEQAASEADVRVLDLLSDAYADGVDSYVGLMEYNIAQLTEGLGGR